VPVYSPAFARYLFHLPIEGKLKLRWPDVWFWAEMVHPSRDGQKLIAHTGTKRAWRTVTTLIETKALPLSQTGNPSGLLMEGC